MVSFNDLPIKVWMFCIYSNVIHPHNKQIHKPDGDWTRNELLYIVEIGDDQVD